MRRVSRSGIGTTAGFGLGAFSRDELDTIHYATLQILQDTGVKVMSEKALEIFHGGGASIERYEGYGIVKIPSYLVEECTFWAPRAIVYDARNPNDDYVAEPNRVGFTTFGGCINVIDPITRELRQATKKDCGDIARVCDYLDEICVIERSVNSTDAPDGTQSVHNLEAILKNTGKHIFIGADSPRALNVMTELAATCAGGKENFKKRPIFTVLVCPMSPLCLHDNTCDVIIESAMSGLGITVIPMALSGGTSTATLAGTLVTHNAEVLSSIVLAQLTKKGLPCTYGSSSTILDLRFGTSSIGSPEFGMINASIAKMAQYYRLPCWVGGGASDSKVPDIQSGYEFTLSATLSALAGGNILFGAGVLEQGLTFDYAKLVMDAEMIRMIQIAIKGIAITDEMLAMDVIHEVGPGGAYITHEHSLGVMRSQSQSRLFDRRCRDDWLELTRGESMRERAYETAIDILQSHSPIPLPDVVSEAMSEIVAEFEEEVKMTEKNTRSSRD
ncbi:MAG: trimethylamine methyltransferase family protein [Deltaproteobacteria bacterium]|nr:MAG: trimethylamine methyltransferase family protein [Deltaproteobacteria bacterium]